MEKALGVHTIELNTETSERSSRSPSRGAADGSKASVQGLNALDYTKYVFKHIHIDIDDYEVVSDLMPSLSRIQRQPMLAEECMGSRCCEVSRASADQ